MPHLSKAFEAICGVEFRSSDPEELKAGGKHLDIMSMVSGEGEVVKLLQPVEPDAEKNRGSVVSGSTPGSLVYIYLFTT